MREELTILQGDIMEKLSDRLRNRTLAALEPFQQSPRCWSEVAKKKDIIRLRDELKDMDFAGLCYDDKQKEELVPLLERRIVFVESFIEGLTWMDELDSATDWKTPAKLGRRSFASCSILISTVTTWVQARCGLRLRRRSLQAFARCYYHRL